MTVGENGGRIFVRFQECINQFLWVSQLFSVNLKQSITVADSRLVERTICRDAINSYRPSQQALAGGVECVDHARRDQSERKQARDSQRSYVFDEQVNDRE